jgi:DNA (cytosine-5)-methyltransferase 1
MTHPESSTHTGETEAIRPKLLDLFCCEGGASEGYRRAGFDVYGIDIFKHENEKGQRIGFSRDRYPFPAHQGWVEPLLEVLVHGGFGVLPFADKDGTVTVVGLDDFSAIHASPPCQHASAGTRTMRARGTSDHPALIEPTRELLEQTDLPWVIENVSGAALRDPILLCGSMFGLATEDEDGFPLRLERHRLFESNVQISAPAECYHDPDVWAGGVYGGARGRKPEWTAEEHRHSARYDRHGGYVPAAIEVQQRLLGIDWMTKGGMTQSLPPVYTEHLGRQLLAHINHQEVAA